MPDLSRRARSPRLILGLAITVATLALMAVPAAQSKASETAGASRACPTSPEPGAFTANVMRSLNAKEWSFGPRPTGSPAHRKMVGWLEGRLEAIDGLRVSSQSFRVSSWRNPRAQLAVETGAGTAELAVPAPVLLSRRTDRSGVTAELTYVAPEEEISAANAAGRIVVREAPAGSVPLSVFFPGALGFDLYDPAGTLEPDDAFEGDFLNYNARVDDLRNAKAAGAAGVLFLKDLPAAQLRGHNEPYEGLHWGVPAVFLGADEAEIVRAAAADGEQATLTVSAKQREVETRTLLATLPGRDPRRLVVESHTDGTNAVEDNGPAALLAMARYLATLSDGCRGRTIQFAFTTGHFYQHVEARKHRHGGSGVLARKLDRQYDRRKVAGVMVLEHLGAREYAAEPRADGIGSVLRPTGLPALQQVVVTPSEVLRSAVSEAIERYEVGRTAMLIGADVPDPDRVPVHCSFGGEGTPYNEQLLPTVAAISAPLTLYNPKFGLGGINFKRMSAETKAFTDLLLEMGQMSAAEIAGDVTADRAKREDGAPGCPLDI